MWYVNGNGMWEVDAGTVAEEHLIATGARPATPQEIAALPAPAAPLTPLTRPQLRDTMHNGATVPQGIEEHLRAAGWNPPAGEA